MNDEFRGKKILVTGGAGSIGSSIVRRLLAYDPSVVRVFSRDDSKQFALRMRLNNDDRLRFLVGDIRDKARLGMAMEDVDIVFHAAALKHVTACENDPFEAVKTNVLGTQNVIECALERGVDKVVGVSTDKAADPTSVLGCTKLLSEKLMQATGNYKGKKHTRFCFVRFGNVIGSRGSVIPLLAWQVKRGEQVTLTDRGMYRFFMSIDDAVGLIFKATLLMRDREVFILKMPIMRIEDLVEVCVDLYARKHGIDPASIGINVIGRKNGERLHEKLVGRDECSNALETSDMFILRPFFDDADSETIAKEYPLAQKVTTTEYTTESPELSSKIMTKEQIRDLLLANDSIIEGAMP
jgi:UDP-N-acetylglucosamine 4,6-dehydratase/5-epimerase